MAQQPASLWLCQGHLNLPICILYGTEKNLILTISYKAKFLKLVGKEDVIAMRATGATVEDAAPNPQAEF